MIKISIMDVLFSGTKKREVTTAKKPERNSNGTVAVILDQEFLGN